MLQLVTKETTERLIVNILHLYSFSNHLKALEPRLAAVPKLAFKTILSDYVFINGALVDKKAKEFNNSLVLLANCLEERRLLVFLDPISLCSKI